MSDNTTAGDILDQALPMQDHRCTAVIEDLCEATPEDAWNEAE